MKRITPYSVVVHYPYCAVFVCRESKLSCCVCASPFTASATIWQHGIITDQYGSPHFNLYITRFTYTKKDTPIRLPFLGYTGPRRTRYTHAPYKNGANHNETSSEMNGFEDKLCRIVFMIAKG